MYTREGGFLNERPLHLFAISAKTEAALIQLAAKYEKYLATNADSAIADIGSKANIGRSPLPHRLAIIASTSSELQAKLKDFNTNRQAANLFQGTAEEFKLAFVFPQTDSNLKAGRLLYETQPIFREAIAFGRNSSVRIRLVVSPVGHLMWM